MWYSIINPKPNSKYCVHPVVTVLELGCLATNNPIFNLIMVVNHQEALKERERELTLKSQKMQFSNCPCSKLEKEYLIK